MTRSLALTSLGGYRVVLSERAIAEVDPSEVFLAIAGRLDSQDPFIRDVAAWYRPI